MGYLALDSECFGLFPFHGDHPHMVSLCTDDLKTTVYEASKINDLNRTATWSKTAIKEINSRIARADRIICHNLKYDVLMCDNIGIGMLNYILAKPDDAEHFFEDTSPLSHIIYNDEPHGLKELAWKYLDIPMFDEFLLHEAINQVHNLRRAWDTATAKGKEPKETALHINYSPHYLEADEDQSSNSADFHLARHHPTLGDSCKEYAGKDALRTMLLWQNYQAALDDDLADRKEAINRIYLREKRLIFTLLRQAGNPIHLRKQALSKLIHDLENKWDELHQSIIDQANYLDPFFDNPMSPDQMADLLFNTLELPIQKVGKKSEKPSVDKDSLKGVFHHLKGMSKADRRAMTHDRYNAAFSIVKDRIELAKIKTLKDYSTSYRDYARDWDTKTPSLIFNYNPQGTVFTRGSSSRVNLQNAGNKDKDKGFIEELSEYIDTELYETSLRSGFGPPPGKVWFSIDFSQIELVIFAILCKSKRLLELLLSADVHDAVERGLYGTSGPNRTRAKIASFRIIYGILAGNFDKAYYPGAYKKYTTELFPEAAPFLEECIKQVETNGYIETQSGYRLHIPKQFGYVGSNAKCQGTAGDIIKLAMIGIDYYLRQGVEQADFDPILQVHDELVFLSDKPCPAIHRTIYTVRRIMELSALHYGIPCKTDLEIIKVSWDNPEKYSFKLSAKEIKLCESDAAKTLKAIT